MLDGIGHQPKTLCHLNFDKLTAGSWGLLLVRIWLGTAVDAAHPMVIRCSPGSRMRTKKGLLAVTATDHIFVLFLVSNCMKADWSQ